MSILSRFNRPISARKKEVSLINILIRLHCETKAHTKTVVFRKSQLKEKKIEIMSLPPTDLSTEMRPSKCRIKNGRLTQRQRNGTHNEREWASNDSNERRMFAGCICRIDRVSKPFGFRKAVSKTTTTN